MEKKQKTVLSSSYDDHMTFSNCSQPSTIVRMYTIQER